ncbi:Furin-1, partial [Geodia barretti]
KVGVANDLAPWRLSLSWFSSFSCLLWLSQSASVLATVATSWAVEIDGGEGEAERLSRAHGLINRGRVGSLSRHYHFELAEPTNGDVSAAITKALSKEISVKHAEPQVVKEHEKRDYIVPADPGWSKQWSLKSAGEVEGDDSRLDMRVEQVWLQGFTGRGVTTTVIDDGLEWKHDDLISNYDPSVSHDFTTDTSDPTPFRGDNHGTECAGVVAMSKNTLCGIGVAFDSKIGGIKINIEESMDVFEARALGYQQSSVDVYSNSWGPKDNGYTVEGPGRLVSKTLQSGAEKGRDGKGNVFVWAAGNGGDKFDSCAADGYVNSIYTIAVGSADQDGRQAYYDEDCSAKMAVTFSHNSRPTGPQVYTTTLDGRCTSGFTGTSASAPLLSGVIALALQANPDLTWRDVQYLIVYTSNIDILTVDDLATNGAGLKFSHHFGFGAIDAEALVTRARHWTSVPQQLNFTIPATQL